MPNVYPLKDTQEKILFKTKFHFKASESNQMAVNNDTA